MTVTRNPVDFKNLEKSIRSKITVEILHNLFLIPDEIYYAKYGDNAETLERDLEIYKELEEIDKFIYFRK